uniref:Uncharacterized protein n=1 Tax=Oryza glumipatula TaxID=40148 RepID=A0A0D9YV89_9ORYZ
MVQIDDEASSMVRSSLNGLDWLPDADGGIGVGDADSEGSWVAADSGDWWLEDQRRQRLHPVSRRWGQDDDMAGTRSDEPFLHSFVDERQQRIVVAIHIEQPNLQRFNDKSDI